MEVEEVSSTAVVETAVATLAVERRERALAGDAKKAEVTADAATRAEEERCMVAFARIMSEENTSEVPARNASEESAALQKMPE